MAPELLGSYANSYFDLEAYKQADMYSFGLVLWEMCSKTKTYKNSEVSTITKIFAFNSKVHICTIAGTLWKLHTAIQ